MKDLLNYESNYMESNIIEDAEGFELSKNMSIIDEFFRQHRKTIFRMDRDAFIKWNTVRNAIIMHMNANRIVSYANAFGQEAIDPFLLHSAILGIQSKLYGNWFDETTKPIWDSLKEVLNEWIKYYDIFAGNV